MEQQYIFSKNVAEVTNEIIEWIKNWFETNCKDSKAVIGMSGGKDSTIVAALLVKALGKDRVIGVGMPDITQGYNEADKICDYLGIKFMECPIGEFTNIFRKNYELSERAKQNIPPRLRMTILYAIAQSINGVVANTSNLSEDYIGYATLFGDSAGSFSPLGKMTVTEILQIGDYLELPKKWVYKTPDDGLPFSCPDEQKFGFTYKTLDEYIREDKEPIGFSGTSVRHKINEMYVKNKFKTDIINLPSYIPNNKLLYI